ncbi:DUF418 domain-containing protein [Rheinheimera sp. UJ51]|uniref:DUF418 domain-containing protein n=1 Tax=Rheinheimera sp. UJ51 TaxID=2892446 RepID=UPI001E4AAC10|nr:DUF418 domain-containing protein [Rheinheimera sp. UJ51]MCC5450641.1 DUF418 domain-containing protein [Rheinheimera sp. UJ51]
MSRLPQLDMIRGFAVLGLILMNIYAFALPPPYSHSLHWSEGVSSLDTLLFSVQTLLLQGRFLTLFNLLFGVSLWLIYQRYGIAYVKRRLYWLALFGLLHGWLLWFGDILLWYALAGLFMLYRGYLALDSAALWRKARQFFVLGLLLPVFYAGYLWFDPTVITPMDSDELLRQQQLWTGPYLAQVIENISFSGYYAISYLLSMFWYSLALMLSGIALFKTQWFQRGFSPVVTAGLFAVGLLLSASIVYLDYRTDYFYDLNTALPWSYLAEVLMALSFASALIHLKQQPLLQRWLIPCGRLAFSLYLTQTVLMVLLFRVLRPDWFASLDRLALTAIALGMIALQLLLSRWYLQRFQQGPLELLWRHLSKQPAAVASAGNYHHSMDNNGQ